MTATQEVDILKDQAEYFKDALDGITKRIEELESQQADKK
jgi:predicted  nucleic acid-binding Zn-ribbon protein